MDFLKAHWDLCLFLFGFGGIYQKHKAHDERLERLEKALSEDIPEIKGMLARIDERTKRL